MVQWLRLRASNVGGMVLSLIEELGSHLQHCVAKKKKKFDIIDRRKCIKHLYMASRTIIMQIPISSQPRLRCGLLLASQKHLFLGHTRFLTFLALKVSQS